MDDLIERIKKIESRLEDLGKREGIDFPTNVDTVDGFHANATPTAANIPVLDSAMAMITPSLYRQALINGNFDIWQRGTSVTGPADGIYACADRWIQYTSANGGTLPTVIHSRQTITPGELSSSFYHYRIAPNGAGSSLGVNSYGAIAQKVEYGTRFLAGNGKKVTLSFWAKSDIGSKRMGVALGQNYGTGGSPTAEEMITGGLFTLTSSWAKYTYTFTTNTLAGKTFGTANDDYLRLFLFVMWGTTTATTYFGGGTAETYVGSGNIDIAQVQLCAGDTALPFMPKSIKQEKDDCFRFFNRLSADTVYQTFAGGQCFNTTQAKIFFFFPTEMRIAPTLSHSGNNNFMVVSSGDIGIATTVVSTGACIGTKSCEITATVASGLTAGNATRLISNNSTSTYIDFLAEL